MQLTGPIPSALVRVLGGAFVLALAATGCGRGEIEVATGRSAVVTTAADAAPGAALVPRLVLVGGTPHVAFHDGSDGSLRLAYPSGASWNVELLAAGDDGAMGAWLAAAAADDGTVHVAFRSEEDDNVGHIEGRPGNWQASQPLPRGEDRGRGLSLALDLAGNPWIAYRNETTAALEVVHRSSGTWILETVDSQGNTGFHPSIAADLGGRMGVAYQDGTDGRLRYAQSSGVSSWTAVTVDTGDSGTVGSFTALAIRAGANEDLFLAFPRILYLDEAANTMRYAEPTSGITLWATEDVDPGLFGGADSCLAVADDGSVWAAFLDASTLDLKVGRRRAGRWRVWTEDPVGATGFSPSCAVDADGRLHVAYARRDRGEILYRVVPERY
jgi:hypothetical protein